MDVVVTNSLFTAGPIFHFHSTQLYNFITGNRLFSAYPEMMCNLQGLFNPRRCPSARQCQTCNHEVCPTRFRHTSGTRLLGPKNGSTFARAI
jgi:hypothetical protein